MDGILDEVSMDEFKIFYRIDRELYSFLVGDLNRCPEECIQIMGLWLWMERGGICNIISKILSLRPLLINQLADEAVACLKCCADSRYCLPEAAEIPLTRHLAKANITLQYFLENRDTVFHEVQNLVTDVYIPALSDLIVKPTDAGIGEISTWNPPPPLQGFVSSGSPSSEKLPQSPSEDSLSLNLSKMNIGGSDSPPSRGKVRENEKSEYSRTMFATFSKGYPVSESEIRQFFTTIFGNCIESLHMQEVKAEEQALYARIVFLRPSFIRVILNGESKAKFTINGKHVWMRQFVPRSGRMVWGDGVGPVSK